MRELGKALDESKPDLLVIFGSDHLETFFLSAVPTFALIAGETANAAFAGKTYKLPIHQAFGEDLLERLVAAGFDMVYSQDAVLGHAFAAVFEWVMNGRKIPVIPIFINTYLPPLPSARRCEALGRAVREVIDSRPEKVAVVASGGLSHFPGTWKYSQPEFEFDHWAIAHMERGNMEPLLRLSVQQLDEVGNTELLSWMALFGVMGNAPGELLSYQPTWHHGHAVMRFLPQRKSAAMPKGAAPSETFEFKNQGYEFYKHPTPSSYKLNKLLFDLRHKPRLRLDVLNNSDAVASEYGLSAEETKALRTLTDENIDLLRSTEPHPLVKVGAHPLGTLMSILVVQADARRLRAEGAETVQGKA